MLSKLIKHEWKNVSKMLILINCFTVAVTFIGCLSAFSPIWQSNVEYMWLLGVSALMIYYITIIVVSFSSMLYLAVRFYKNMYTDEGYLMHTLPVTPRQLIISKGIVAVCWSLITGLLIMVSVCSLGVAFMVNLDPDMLRSTLKEMMGLASIALEELFGMKMIVIVLWGIVYSIIGSISGICIIYGSISLGQLFQKHKVLGAFLSYFGVYMVLQTLTSIVMTPLTTRMIMSEVTGEMMSISSFLNPTLLGSLIISTIVGAAMYILTVYIMTKKLNLD